MQYTVARPFPDPPRTRAAPESFAIPRATSAPFPHSKSNRVEISGRSDAAPDPAKVELPQPAPAEAPISTSSASTQDGIRKRGTRQATGPGKGSEESPPRAPPTLVSSNGALPDTPL